MEDQVRDVAVVGEACGGALEFVESVEPGLPNNHPMCIEPMFAGF